MLSPDHIEALARSSKFVQRASSLTPEKFLDILIKDASSPTGLSLLDYSNELQIHSGLNISAQGIDDRFNDYAVKFMNRLLSDLLQSQLFHPLETGFLKRYSSVLITDSVKLELPGFLKDDFPGFGGGASEAGLSIQYRYDLKNQTGNSLDVYPATYSDSIYTKQIRAEEGTLELFDLGYVTADFLKRLDTNKSHFVCRLHSKSIVYNTDGNELNFEKLYRWMRLYKIPVFQREILVGEKRQPLRLVISLVDDQTYEKRLQNNQKNNRKKGHQTSQEHKCRMHFNLMLTNTDPKEIPYTQVYLLYKLRWQIELCFKSWKSAGWHLDKIKKVKYERYMCILYAKLLMIILSHQIHGVQAREHYMGHKKILSRAKCIKTLSPSYRFDSSFDQ